jgi:hypothetical protein
MAGDNGSSFPFTALSVALLFLSSTYLAQHGFDLWRQPDSDAKRVQLSEPPVEARLWEDPLGALIRHRERLKELCPDGKASKAKSDATPPGAGPQEANPACRSGQAIGAARFREDFVKDRGVTLIAVMLPGAALVGAEEQRRRSRYAVLAGLNADGFVPTDSERMGLVTVDRCESFAGCITRAEAEKLSDEERRKKTVLSPMEIAFEKMTTKDGKGRQAAVLWIDDTAIGRRWLSATAMVLKELTPSPNDQGVELRIVGPTRSDILVTALGDDLTALAGEARAASAGGGKFAENWRTLAKLRLFSALSTTPASQLREAARSDVSLKCTEIDNQRQLEAQKQVSADAQAPPTGRPADCVAEIFRLRLKDIVDKDGKDLNLDRAQPVFFVRTVGTDDLLIRRLIVELQQRGVDQCVGNDNRRIVLLSEWDSIYARTFSDSLQEQLECSGKKFKVKLHTYSYLRGLDGATLEGISAQTPHANDKARGDKGPPVEWPEGRAQADYVRRLVEAIRRDNDEYPVHAVGMIGSDVHDKLVLMQALREAFPDRILFTTDIDARLAHPSTTRYTRNVIVASSLPLELEGELAAGANRIGPFRDAYQTAMFLAARLAGLAPKDTADCKTNADHLACLIEAAVMTPKLFEIGRDSIVDLPAKGIASGETDKRLYSAGAAFALLVAFSGLILVGHPGPAMQHAWRWWSPKPQDAVDRAHTAIAGLQVAALGFAVGVLLELAFPGSVGAFGPLVLAFAAALLFHWVVFPGKPWAQALRPAAARADAVASRLRVVSGLALAACVAVVVWLVVVSQRPDAQMHEPFAPLSGVSTWPSELLRTLAIVLFAWFLDEAWCRSVEATQGIGENYRLFQAKPPETRTVTGWKRLLAAVYWLQPPTALEGRRVDGAKLWNQYRMLMDSGPRLERVVVWLVLSGLALLLVAVVVNALTDAPWPGLPARGLADRFLFGITLVLSTLAVVVLLVLVADLTVLTMWFVDRLRDGRTVYPTPTVSRFADELGPELRKQACYAIAPYPERRKGLGPDPAHENSILDDWIDTRLLAEHTEATGRLIIFPFILVALLVVARSRLFDNWEIGGAVLVVLVIYLLWSIALAAMLNFSAEQARRKALDSMEADLRWLKGAGKDYEKLAETFEGLIKDVRSLRKGAFAPFFEQPLVQAILVPLGGAGGVQLLDWLLRARA